MSIASYIVRLVKGCYCLEALYFHVFLLSSGTRPRILLPRFDIKNVASLNAYREVKMNNTAKLPSALNDVQLIVLLRFLLPYDTH